MKTLKQFVTQSNLDSKLLRAVVRQVGGWENFKEIARDVASHGASGGFSGFIYYMDTVAFTKRNKAAVVASLENLASDIGEGGIISLLAGSNCLKGESQEAIAGGLYNPRHPDRTTVYNALAWYALEEACRSYCDLVDGY